MLQYSTCNYTCNLSEGTSGKDPQDPCLQLINMDCSVCYKYMNPISPQPADMSEVHKGCDSRGKTEIPTHEAFTCGCINVYE